MKAGMSLAILIPKSRILQLHILQLQKEKHLAYDSDIGMFIWRRNELGYKGTDFLTSII